MTRRHRIRTACTACISHTSHTSRTSRVLLAAVAVALLAAAGCRSNPAEDPILRLSAAEALAEGKELMAQGKYTRAQRYLSQAYEVEPNSIAGREGLLLLADSYYLASGETNWIQAEAKYRDFLNRFPTSDRAAYVQMQIGNALAARVERPDRDQSVTRAALGVGVSEPGGIRQGLLTAPATTR